MTQRFTSRAQSALKKATEIASSLGHTYIGSEHLLYGLAAEGEGVASRLLEGGGVSADKIRNAISGFAGIGRTSQLSASDMTPRLRHIIEVSGKETAGSVAMIGTEHLLLALLAEADCVGVKLLNSLGVNLGEIRSDLHSLLESTRKEGVNKRKESVMDALPNLSGFGRDLTAAAAAGRLDPVIGREREIGRVIRILSRRSKNNPCLVGEPGVGKTAIVEGLALRIAEGTVPESLRKKTVFSLDLSSMIAGAKYRGEFEERMKNVMEELRKNPSVLLFIDEIHTIVGAGAAEGAIDAANILKPAMARGEVRVIGATTMEEYRRHIEKDSALERRFQPITVEEPTPEETGVILEGIRKKYEEHHGLQIPDEAIRAAISLSVRYLPDRFLPDKAIDLIDEAASEMRLRRCSELAEVKNMEDKLRQKSLEKENAVLCQDYETASRLRDEERRLQGELEALREKEEGISSGKTLTPALIAETVSESTGIPVSRLREEEGAKLESLDAALNARVIGQEEAVRAITRAVRRGRAGMKDPARPIGSFLFLGPTGVGKTELCRALAAALFGNEESLLRFDMSEYMEKHSVSRLVGSPPGYVGHDEGGQLTERIRRRPYSVLLFDEIEKAHPDVYNLLLQILEDGMLTDAQGRTAYFKNAIIILTSNLGAERVLMHPLGFANIEPTLEEQREQERQDSMAALRREFRPELLNRLDEIVLFRKLTREDLLKIAALRLQQTAERVREVGITLRFAEEVAELMVKLGYSEEYGARALRRTIVNTVEDPLSAALIAGELAEGDTVVAEVAENGVVFRKEAPARETCPT